MSTPVANTEPRWHASIGIVVALALYVTLPPKYTFGPFWLFPLLVLGLLIPLSLAAPFGKRDSIVARSAALTLIAILNLFNAISVVLLVAQLLHPSTHHRAETGAELLIAGTQIWAMNILVFALWYWELDSGGPAERTKNKDASTFDNPDFQFPQMSPSAQGQPMCALTGWKPLFIDYVYLAFNTATALSPADTFPLSRMGKMLMMTESLISLATIAVIERSKDRLR